MIADSALLFRYFGIFVVLTAICGAYCIVATLNLIRAFIGVELLIKAATLLIILAGYVTGNTALAQSLVITLIVVEVALMVVVGGVVLCAFRHHKTIDSRKLTEMKG
jgi:NADH:ubiquinone oxidoreductase subunit K